MVGFILYVPALPGYEALCYNAKVEERVWESVASKVALTLLDINKA
ncbi:hypothetical protein [Paenibacillus xylanexedens]|nr:hypothetical protein [Paenibacillus xylanexedens]